MIVKLHAKIAQEVLRNVTSNSNELSKSRYKNWDVKTRVNLTEVTKEELAKIKEIALRESTGTLDPKAYTLINKKISNFMALEQSSGDDRALEKLEDIVPAMKAYFKDSPRKWIFRTEDDGAILPYFLKEVEFEPRRSYRGDVTPAHVNLDIIAYRDDTTVRKSITIWKEQLPMKCSRIIAKFNAKKETQAAVEAYVEEFERYTKMTGESFIGQQMLANGEGKVIVSDRWGSSGKLIPMVRDGIQTKVVIDHTTPEREKGSSCGSSNEHIYDDFWGVIEDRDYITSMSVGDEQFDLHIEKEEEDSEMNKVQLPIHPYINVFDLFDHQWVLINTMNLEDYEWDDTLMDKLVLNKEHKDLISILMGQTSSRVEDIISGKMSGVVVLATGNPGLGKTLTAEVFSESIKRPLYIVQCSQLGLSVDSIEEKLTDILNRASRWGAILLIDEADVYIRQRGEDITQNAIVGVFLRLIEYYRGILFMTSNRGKMIDDAIMSRATAWIQYQSPNEELLGKIWQVLGTQYGANFTKADITRLSKEFIGISGRSVRNLLKLANLLVAGTDNKITVDMILGLKGYQALES